MTGVSRTPQELAARPYGWVAVVMFLLPVVLGLAAYGLARVYGAAPTLVANFQPSDLVLKVLAALGLPYAAVFMVCMNRVRRSLPPPPPGSKAGKGELTIASICWMGFVVWVMVPLVGGIAVGGAINQMVGTMTTEPARIWVKRVKTGKGCHRTIGIVSATVPDGESLCVPPADWDRLDEGDSVPIVSIVSGLGREVGLAPGALSHVTKREP